MTDKIYEESTDTDDDAEDNQEPQDDQHILVQNVRRDFTYEFIFVRECLSRIFGTFVNLTKSHWWQ